MSDTTVAPSARLRLELTGAAILGAGVAWTWWSARGGGGHPIQVVALQLACGASYVAARLATGWQRPVVPVTVAAGAASVLVIGSVLPSLAPLGPPLGYTNSNAALYVLVAVAALMAAAAFPAGPATAVAVPCALAFALATVASGSVTGIIVLGLTAAALAACALGSPRTPVLLSGTILLLVVAVTALIGVARVEGSRAPLVDRAIDERRALLWRDAAVIARAHPLSGAGPGRFSEESPTARNDADARWAHSGFLQQAAEQGAVGLALLFALFGWGFVGLWRAGIDDPFTALGALALAALGFHASVDYVLHFPAVPLVAAALVGAAMTPRPDRAQGLRWRASTSR